MLGEKVDAESRRVARELTLQSGRPLGEAVRWWLRLQGVQKIGELPFHGLPKEIREIVESAVFERVRRNKMALVGGAGIAAGKALTAMEPTGPYLELGALSGALAAVESPEAHRRYQARVRELGDTLRKHEQELERHGIVLGDYTHVAIGGYGDVYLLRENPKTPVQRAFRSQPLRTYVARIK
ncbi:hypothetical protein HY572_06890 [Candidatus Micrarchaeota archaeon]|nr:hypothetical protein [Candidatus Micrarchaeota archaeon]